MNERIKLLAEQAERLAEDELAHLERVHNRLYSFTEGREIYSQKFAELVIQDLVNSMSVENSDLYYNEDNNWGCIAVKFWVDGDPSAMLGEQIQSRFADGSVRGTGSHRLNHEFVRYLMSKHFENKE